MLINALMILLVGTSSWLWWKLSITQATNSQLQTELAKLRLRLRTSGK